MEKSHPSLKIITISFAIISIMVGMSLSSYLLSRFILKIQKTTEKTITVKGVAEKTIKSDVASFNLSVGVNNTDKAKGYKELARVKIILHNQLKNLGFTNDMIFDPRIVCDERYNDIKTTVNGRTTERREFAHYRLTYSVTVRTKDVDLVNKNILRFHDLAMNNIDISVSNPEFYINDLEQYKLELVNLASASAAERAKVAASQSGSNLGPLMTARQGVIQITEPACNDTSDYGVYNTSSVTKVIRLVMTMTFSLK